MTDETKTKTLFGTEKNPSNIIPMKYTLDSKIKFQCHPGVSCFTACCGNIDIILTPFDILRLRQELNMSSDEFLLRFTTPMWVEKTDLPGVKLNLDENQRCPFVTEKGCTIYEHRPSACRYYPIGMANFHQADDDGADAEKFFFVVKEEHCKGHDEPKEWTIRDWRADQGVDLCDEMNVRWMQLVMRRKSYGFQASMSPEGQKMFFMVSTNLEKFKKFIFDSSFLDTYIIDDKELEEIKNDDIKLMFFGFKYLAGALFGAKTLQIRQDKIDARVEMMKNSQDEHEANAEAAYKELVADRDALTQQIKKDKEE